MDTFSSLFHYDTALQILVNAGVLFLIVRFWLLLGFMYWISVCNFQFKNSPWIGKTCHPVHDPPDRIASETSGPYQGAGNRNPYAFGEKQGGNEVWEHRASPNHTTEIIFNNFFTEKSKPFPVNKVY